MIVSPSAFVYGGLATWLDDLESAGNEIGCEIIVGLVMGPRHHRPDQYIAEHPQRHWERIMCRTGTPEGRGRALRQVIERIEPDLVVSVNIADVYTAVGRLRQQGKFSGKCMMALHGLDAKLFQQLHLVRPVLDGVTAVNRLACRLCTQLAEVERERVHHAVCGVAKDTQPIQLRSHDGVFRIAYVGRLEQDQKRVLDLPKILNDLDRRCGRYELLIAGSGPDEAALRAGFEQRALKEIRWLGPIGREQVIEQVYRQADALLLTSLWETGPLVIREAMAHGLPVVTSRYIGSGLESTLKDGLNVLMFDIGDTQTASSQLGRIMNENSLAQRLATDARQLVEQCYSLDCSIRQWRMAFEKTLVADALPTPQASMAMPYCGRLDRLLGQELGEAVRTILRRKSHDAGPGGEWPHITAGLPPEEEGYWQMIADEDGVPFVDRARSQAC